jgi:hypothetical protein
LCGRAGFVYRAFLQALFGLKPDDLYILIWTLKNHSSRWFDDLETAEKYVETCVKQDTYIGVGLSPTDNGRGKRCEADNIAGIVGLWADIDIQSDYHKKTNLPPDEEAAMQLVDEMGMAPTVLVHSGHGLQAWWLFREPWIFNDADERKAAHRLSLKWTKSLQLRAKNHGWTMDSTQDLARVLRVPGTANLKDKDHPTEVRIISYDGDAAPRYEPEDFNDHILDEGLLHSAAAETVDTTGLRLEPTADPPFMKFQALMENEPKFAASWKHARSEKDMPDQSPSSYDMSLATYAVQAGWDNQEIINLLISHRRKYGEDLKLRLDYYHRTLTKAREGQEKADAKNGLVDAMHDIEGQVEDVNAWRTKILADVSKLLGFRVRRVVEQVGDPPQYRIETDFRDIKLGGIEGLTSQTAFRNRVAEAIRFVIGSHKADEWRDISQAILKAVEEESLGDEATDRGRAELWVSEFLRTHKILDEWVDTHDSQCPLRRDGFVYIPGPSLRRWLQTSMGEKVTSREMGAVLRTLGCEPIIMPVVIGGRVTSRWMWQIPAQLTITL